MPFVNNLLNGKSCKNAFVVYLCSDFILRYDHIHLFFTIVKLDNDNNNNNNNNNKTTIYKAQ